METRSVIAKTEIFEILSDFPIVDEVYVIGKVTSEKLEKPYFFSWGDKIPKRMIEAENNVEVEIPVENIPNGEDGVEFFATKEEAVQVMKEAKEAVETTA